MVDILVNSFVSGYFQMYGSCFCTNPTLNYVAGSLGLGEIWPRERKRRERFSSVVWGVSLLSVARLQSDC